MEPTVDTAAMSEAVSKVLPGTQVGNTHSSVIDGFSVMATLTSNCLAVSVYRRINVSDTYRVYWQLNQLNSSIGIGKGTYSLIKKQGISLLHYHRQIQFPDPVSLQELIRDALARTKSGYNYLLKGM